MTVIVFIHIYYYNIVEKVGTSLWCIKKHLYQIKENQTLKQKPSFYSNLQTEARYSKNYKHKYCAAHWLLKCSMYDG